MVRRVVPPETLLDFLRRNNDFLVLTHVNPDADGLGSALALCEALEKVGKHCVLADRDPVPALYRFLPGSESFRTVEDIKGASRTFSEFTSVILIDCNHADRVVRSGETLFDSSFRGTVAVIDHHEWGPPYGDVTWILPEAPATGMMVYHLITSLGLEISPTMAANLYAAIVLDTGNFRYENTTAEVLSIASKLTEAGAEPHDIFRHLYELWPQNRFDLFLRVLNSIELVDGIAVTTVTKKMLTETSTSADDTETFVSFPRIMEQIRVSILLREIDEDHYKVSLRSKDDIDVAVIAKLFGGGGHKNAAGCTVRAKLDTVKNRLLKALQSY